MIQVHPYISIANGNSQAVCLPALHWSRKNLYGSARLFIQSTAMLSPLWTRWGELVYTMEKPALGLAFFLSEEGRLYRTVEMESRSLPGAASAL